MTDRDLVREFQIYEYRHRLHGDTVSVLLGCIEQGKINMAEQVLNVTAPPTTSVTAVLGAVRDVNGNVVTDPVASGTWTADNSLVGTVAAATDGTLNAVVTLVTPPAAGTLNVTFAGLTASGAAITGAAQLVVATTVTPPPPSGATTVDVTLTAVP